MGYLYEYDKDAANVLQLHQQILDANLGQTLLTVEDTLEPSPGKNIKCIFDAQLSGVDETVLAGVISGSVEHFPGQRNHKVETWLRRKKVKEEWFNNLDGNGDPIEKVYEIVYAYHGRRVMSETHRVFYIDGTQIGEDEIYNYSTVGDERRKKRQ